MKLYFSPGACSLADHIAMHEAGLKFEHEKVDLKSKKTESGEDFTTINPKGYVPALVLDGGELLTENIAILDHVAGLSDDLSLPGPLGRSRLLETLAFISTEIHKSFKPFFSGAGEEDKARAAAMIAKRLGFLAERMEGNYLFGSTFSAADAYLFVMLLWARKNGLDIPKPLDAFFERVQARPAVQTAMRHEGLA